MNIVVTKYPNILFIFILTIVVAFISNTANASHFISDSLVNNLDCRNLTKESIYASIQPEAFATSKHIPIHNWSFPNGSYSLGVCWSLSHTQRLFFYLAQWNNLKFADSRPSAINGLDILNLIRGSKPIKGTLVDIRETELQKYYNFQIHSFSTESGLFADLVNGIWDPLYRFSSPINSETNNESNSLNFTATAGTEDFYPFKLENGKLLRNIRSEVEKYQRWRFYQFENSKLATELVPRSRRTNHQLSQKLIAEIDKKRLPMVDIKPNITAQHIVLIKFYEYTNEFIKFFVYDSNSPKIDNFFIYDIKSQEFKAPHIIKRFPGVNNPDQPISVYLVDDHEHDKIASALQSYYSIQCQQNNN